MADIEPSAEGSCVLLFPQIVKTIFQFLPAKSICNVASVCRLWKSQADIVLHQRKQFCWQLFEGDTGDGYYVPGHSVVWSSIQQFFEDIAFRPRTVLIFMTLELWEECTSSQGERAGQKTKKKEVSVLRNCLPPECRVLYSVTNGIIGTSSDLSQTAENEEGDAAAVLCFGDHPGVEVVPCRSCDTPDNYYDYIFKIFNSPAERPELLDVKAVLLMPVGFQSSLTDIKDRKLFQSFQRPLVVGGIADKCYVDGPELKDSPHFFRCHPAEQLVDGDQSASESIPCKNSKLNSNAVLREKVSRKYLSHVLIRGEGVRVACVKFTQDVLTESQAEQTVLRLKEVSEGFNPQHSVAFMYACVARGEEHYDKKNVESAAFRKHFPTTPLMGFFGQGEIGFEYPIQSQLPQNIVHGYTTFIALICFP